jgi:hypothetical protein
MACFLIRTFARIKLTPDNLPPGLRCGMPAPLSAEHVHKEQSSAALIHRRWGLVPWLAWLGRLHIAVPYFDEQAHAIS